MELDDWKLAGGRRPGHVYLQLSAPPNFSRKCLPRIKKVLYIPKTLPYKITSHELSTAAHRQGNRTPPLQPH